MGAIFPHRGGGDGAVGCIPILNWWFDYREQLCKISGRLDKVQGSCREPPYCREQTPELESRLDAPRTPLVTLRYTNLIHLNNKVGVTQKSSYYTAVAEIEGTFEYRRKFLSIVNSIESHSKIIMMSHNF